MAESSECNNTWAGRCQHGQSRLVLLPPLEALQELLLALQQTEGPAEACVKDVMDPCNVTLASLVPCYY